MNGEILILAGENEPWVELLSKRFSLLRVEAEALTRRLEEKPASLLILGKRNAQRDDWVLCRGIKKAVPQALIGVVQDISLEPPIRGTWIDDLLDPAAPEEFFLRVENLLRVARANACFLKERERTGLLGTQTRKFCGENGFLPPFRVTGRAALDPEITGYFVRLLASIVNTTASFVPVSASPPWLSEDPDLVPFESVGQAYCRAVADSVVRIGGVSPCRYHRWLASLRAAIERRTVTLPCPGGLTLYATPVYLEFFRAGYPLGALVVGTGEIPLGPELVKIGHRLRLSVPLLREKATVGRTLMPRSEQVAVYQLLESAADYLAREVSYRYNVAYHEFLQATACSQLAEKPTEEEKQPVAALERAEKLAAMGKLAAGLIHEIRNPLTSVRGFIQLLAEKKPAGDREREYLEVVLSEIDRVNEIICNFLYLSRTGKFRPVATDLGRVIKDILMIVENQAALKGIKLSAECAPDVPLVLVDPEQMRQVLLNLVQNAFQAMPYGGRLTVRLHFDRKENNVVLEVEDTGVGIPPEHFSRLGEAFFTTKEDGTGLGLAISYRIIEDHQGKITVTSKEGEGTRFTITLPVEPRQ